MNKYIIWMHSSLHDLTEFQFPSPAESPVPQSINWAYSAESWIATEMPASCLLNKERSLTRYGPVSNHPSSTVKVKQQQHNVKSLISKTSVQLLYLAFWCKCFGATRALRVVDARPPAASTGNWALRGATEASCRCMYTDVWLHRDMQVCV